MHTADIRPITTKEYRDMPEGPPYFQLIEGDLYMSPSPNFFHQSIIWNLAAAIDRYLEKHPCGVARFAPSDVELSEISVFQPDLYFVANERRHILTEQGIAGAPDLVVEVLSLRTEAYDRGAKRLVYARSGVKELWFIDPDDRAVDVYDFTKSVDEPAAKLVGDDLLRSSVLSGFELPLKQLFKK